MIGYDYGVWIGVAIIAAGIALAGYTLYQVNRSNDEDEEPDD